MPKRKVSFAQRISATNEGFRQGCVILGCGRRTMRAAGIGLAAFHCRRHVEHKARHGSHWHGTYTAAELKPYLAAAISYIRPRAKADRFLKHGLNAIALLLEEAGPTEIATRLKGMSAAKRARTALARLRVARIKPERFVAIVLAVTALIEEDPGSHRTKEFRRVQIAKAMGLRVLIGRLAPPPSRTQPKERPNGTTSRHH